MLATVLMFATMISGIPDNHPSFEIYSRNRSLVSSEAATSLEILSNFDTTANRRPISEPVSSGVSGASHDDRRFRVTAVKASAGTSAELAPAPKLRVAMQPAMRPTVRPKSDAARPGLFGAVAIPFRHLPALERMEPIFASIGRGDVLACTRNHCTDASDTLQTVIEGLHGQGFTRKLSVVNSAVNHLIAYRADSETYGSRDHWAAAAETLDRRAGDCEDYAILKMTALHEAGIPLTSMSIVVLRDRTRNLFHAVLAVSTDRGAFILDNMRDTVTTDGALPQYQPLYAVSAGRGVIFGLPHQREELVALGSDLSDAVDPGAGPADDTRSRPSATTAVEADPTDFDFGTVTTD